MDKATAAEMSKHLKVLFSAFPTAARADEAMVARTYLGVLETYSVEAVRRSVQQFITGKVPTHDGRFVPSAAELARNVDQWDVVLRSIEERRLAPPLASGILSVDYGHGAIDMTKLSLEEQDEVLRTHQAPKITIGPVSAKLQRMTDRQRGYSVGAPESDSEAA